MEDFNSKYTGEQVEALLDQVASGNAGGGGGGGIAVETDPIFSASPAASITDAKKEEWDNKVDKVNGKQLSTEDFTTALKTKLEGLNNYDDTELSNAIETLREDFDNIVSGDTTTAIKTFNEVIAFLEGIQDTQDLSSIIASIEQQIVGKMDKVTLSTVATSGSYNDLSDKPTIPPAVTESTVSGWGFTKNTGTYSKPSGGIPASDLASDVFLQGEKGEQGEQGEKGDDGVGIASVVQTTTSNTDGGSNVVTVTLTDGTSSTFTVKNGSKGSQGEQGVQGVQGPKGDQGEQGIQGVQGIQGEQGPKGDTGADGAQGPKGDKGDKGDTGANGTNGTNGKDGADGEDGATFTPSVDSAGNLSWTNNKGLTNPPTVNIKGPKGDAGSGGGGGGESYAGNYPYMEVESYSGLQQIKPNTYYKYVTPFTKGSTVTFEFTEPENTSIINEYIVEFSTAEDISIAFPGTIRWANDTPPTIEANKNYVVSVVNNIGVFVVSEIPSTGLKVTLNSGNNGADGIMAYYYILANSTSDGVTNLWTSTPEDEVIINGSGLSNIKVNGATLENGIVWFFWSMQGMWFAKLDNLGNLAIYED